MEVVPFPELPVQSAVPSAQWLQHGILYFPELVRDQQQQELFHYFTSQVEDSDDYKEMSELPPSDRPWPIFQHNQVYTRTGNVERAPRELLQWFQRLYDSVKSLSSSTQDVDMRWDSVYVQLYPEEGMLGKHKDIGIDIGGSISLGGTSCIDFHLPHGVETLVQKSGDVVIANFGHIEHELHSVKGSDAPQWWIESTVRNGRARFNVQLRDTTRLSAEIAKRRMTHEQYMKWYKKQHLGM